jgi:hypothetical protein
VLILTPPGVRGLFVNVVGSGTVMPTSSQPRNLT